MFSDLAADQRPQNRGSATKRRVRWMALRTVDRFRPRPRGTDQRGILLYAQNALMADYLLMAWDALSPTGSVRGVITQFPGWNQTYSRRATDLGLGSTPMRRALTLRSWDLVILADHAPMTFPPSTRQLILPHGPGPSRCVRAGSYYYDRARCFWPNGNLVYQLMLDTSYLARDAAAQWVPEYADRIRIVGDLRADRLFQLRTGAQDRAAELGWGARQIVAVMSTWGQHGLMQAHSEWLLPALMERVHGGDLSLVITMHQQLWDGRDSEAGRWASMVADLEGPFVRVIHPGESLETSLSMADIAISDHTSLAMTATVLDIPIVPVRVDLAVLGEGTFARSLQQTRRAISSETELNDALAGPSRYRIDGLPRVIDHVGESREKTRAAILEALGVEVSS